MIRYFREILSLENAVISFDVTDYSLIGRPLTVLDLLLILLACYLDFDDPENR